MKIKNKIKLLGLLGIVFCGNTIAANTTANFQAQTTLNAACSISVNNLNFGNITAATSGEIVVLDTINLICSKNVLYTITLSPGNSGNVMARQMVGTNGNSDRLNYNVYYRSGRIKYIWGETASGGVGDGTAFSFINPNNSQTSWEYGARIPLNQYIKPDTYSDTLTLNIIY